MGKRTVFSGIICQRSAAVLWRKGKKTFAMQWETQQTHVSKITMVHCKYSAYEVTAEIHE